MRELFKKSGSRNFINKLAGLLGVRTSGAGYNIETTMPKRYNSGSLVPGTGNTDTVPAMLTPGEFVVNKQATAKHLPLLRAINQSNGPTSGIGHSKGDLIQKTKYHLFSASEWASRMLASENWQAEKQARHVIHDAAILNKLGMDPDSAVKEADKLYKEARAKAYNSKTDRINEEVWMQERYQQALELDKKFGGKLLKPVTEKRGQIGAILPSPDILDATRRLGIISDRELGRIQNQLFGSSIWDAKTSRWIPTTHQYASEHTDPIEKWNYRAAGNFGQAMAGNKRINTWTNAFRALTASTKTKFNDRIPATNTEMQEAMSSVAKSMGFGSEKNAINNLLKTAASGKSAYAFGLPKQLLQLAMGVNARRNLGIRLNGGGIVPGYGRGDVVKSIVSEFPSWIIRNEKVRSLSNTDPLHGPLQIGRYISPLTIRNRRQGASIQYRSNYRPFTWDKGPRAGETAWSPRRTSSTEAFLTGSLEERGKYVTEEYMRGNYSVLRIPGAIEAMKAWGQKATGTFHRGITLRGWSRVGGQMPPLPEWLIGDIELAKKTGDFSKLIGKEFIMRRSSWSSNQETAKGFGDFQLQADVKNRRVTPASQMFPELDFLTPGAKVKVNESESIFGGKFRIVGAGHDGLKLETVTGPMGGKRAMGGPVNAGMPYLVGENGPELFTPNRSGKIIPHYAGGGFVKNFILPSALGYAGLQAGSTIGGKLGGDTGSMIGGMLGGVAGSIPFGRMGKDAEEAAGGLGKFSAITSKLPSVLKGTLFGVSRLNIAVAGLTTAAVLGYKAFQSYQENQRVQALGFGLTADSAQKAGLKFTDYNKNIKDAIANAKAMQERNQMLYESMTQANTPLKMTVEQYKKLRTEVKTTMSDYIKLFDKTKTEKVGEVAAQLKAQFIAAGESAENATAKIYALIEQSNKAGQGFSAITSTSFRNVNTPQQAAAEAASTFAKSMNGGNEKAQASGLLTAFQAIDTAIADSAKKNEEAVKKNKEAFKSLGQIAEEQIAKINKGSAGQIQLTQGIISQIKKQNPELAKILNSTDTLTSSWAKYQLILKGVSADLSNMSGKAAEAALKIANAVSAATSDVTKDALKGQYAKYDNLTARIKKLTAAARGQSIQDQQSDKDKIKSLNKRIELINKEADDKIKALQKAQTIENAELDIQRARLEYQQAVARGDKDAAAQAQMRIQQTVSERQTSAAEESILANAAKAIAPLQAEIEAINNKQEKLANAAALAGQELDKLQGEATTLKSNLEGLNSLLIKITTNRKLDPTYMGSEREAADLAALTGSMKSVGAKQLTNLKMPSGKIGSTEAGFLADVKKRYTGAESLLGQVANSMAIDAKVVNLYTTETKAGNAKSVVKTTPIGMGQSTYSIGYQDLPTGTSQKIGTIFTASNGQKYKITGTADRSGTIPLIPVKGAGGGVLGNTPYVVGEKGPELFIPSFSGTIIPNNQFNAMYNVPNSSWGMSGSPSSGGGVYNNSYNVKIELSGTNLSADDVYNKFEQKLAMLNAKQGRNKMIGGGR